MTATSDDSELDSLRTIDSADSPYPTRNPFGSKENPKTLFGEILDWLLAPLLLLWPISIVATNHVAQGLANEPYDQALANSVTAIYRLIDINGKRITVNLPAPASTLLRADDEDTLYYQVAGNQGQVIHGDSQIPPVVAPAHIEPGHVQFRDDRIDGESVRVAYAFMEGAEHHPLLSIQVAETRRKREALASRIISGVLLPQFAVIPLAVILVYLGLSRGIAPLNQLRSRIRRRKPSDLSPIPTDRIPEEVKPLVIAFNEMMGRLDENLQSQQRFISQAAHQMRTPLTGLKTQTELALAETDPGQMHRALKLIAESTDRAAHLITQLLILARAEASQEKMATFEVVDIDMLARKVAEEWVMAALRKSIDLGFEGTETPLMIEGVPLLLHELIFNLVDNAVKYTPAGGRITISVRAEEQAPALPHEARTSFAIVEVEDNGIGIAEEERPKIFERFYRVLGTDADGSGLGLPIAAEIAELHNTEITLHTPGDGNGSLFRIAFQQVKKPLPRVLLAADLAVNKPSSGTYPIGL